jgi:hypothetical protein
MATASAAAAAAASTTAQATTVTITLTNNDIGTQNGDRLSADLFGNGNIFSFATRQHESGFFYFGYGRFKIHTFFGAGGGGSASASVAFSNGKANVGSHTTAIKSAFGATASVMGDIPIRFSDPSVNGGAITDGFLTVTAAVGTALFANSAFAEVTLNSFSYNMASVPETGSTLGLLALGAAGVIALRQRRKTT